MSTTAQSSASTDSVNGDKLQVQEIEIPVPWGHISGRWWGPKMIQPILALHGRQDNAGTFDTLIPSLPDNVSVLCLDMPGHGLSAHYPKGQSYYVYWDGIILLRRIVKYFQWSKVKLLGHSMGGAIAFLYAATYPDEVEFLICLDIASPSIWDLNKVASTMGQDIDRILKFETTATKSPSYKYNDMIDIVFDAHGGSLDREGAEILMKRGMKPANTPDTYSFSRDVRLKMRTLAVFPLEFSLILASQIKCQYLNIRYVRIMITPSHVENEHAIPTGEYVQFALVNAPSFPVLVRYFSKFSVQIVSGTARQFGPSSTKNKSFLSFVMQKELAIG